MSREENYRILLGITNRNFNAELLAAKLEMESETELSSLPSYSYQV